MTDVMTNELLEALLSATDEQKSEALLVLRGEAEDKTTEPQYEPYFTLREVARRLNVSACSLWRWQVPGHKFGGRRKFKMSEVVAYLESSQMQSRAEELKRERRA